MKKSTYSIAAIFAFILLGIATSPQEEYAMLAITNTSSSCEVKKIAFSHIASGSLLDTFEFSTEDISPGDSIFIGTYELNYRALFFDCKCPGDTTTHTRSVDISALANKRDMGTVKVNCN